MTKTVKDEAPESTNAAAPFARPDCLESRHLRRSSQRVEATQARRADAGSAGAHRADRAGVGRMSDLKAARKVALAEASRKYATPRRKRAKPANGVKESDRELRARMNWLRERIAA